MDCSKQMNQKHTERTNDCDSIRFDSFKKEKKEKEDLW